MKLIKLFPVLGLALLFVSSNAHAQGGAGHVGGGNVCTNELNKHRFALQGWIQRDEAQLLEFSKAKVPGWSYNGGFPLKSYKQKMLSVLEEGQVVITCYLDQNRESDSDAVAIIAHQDGVRFKTITIGNPPVPTMCINYDDTSGVSHIDCNYDMVMDSKSVGNPDFVLTHHEYASIAGVEARINGNVPDFSVSNQLSQFEHWAKIKLLGPRNTSSVSEFCKDKIVNLIDYLSIRCFALLQKIPNPVVTDADQTIEWIQIVDFKAYSHQTAMEWKAGFGKTCGGESAQDACLSACRNMGLLKYCFESCAEY